MNIGIDISQVVYGTGVSVYTKELVRELLLLKSEHHFTLFAGVLRRSRDLDAYVKTLSGNFTLVTAPIPPRVADVLWNYIQVIPIEFFVGNVSLFHTSDWTEPRARCPKISTVHDLSPLLYPETAHPRVKRVFLRKLHLLKESQNHVIVPSLTIENELLKQGFLSTHIHTIYEAPHPALINAPQLDVFKRFSLPKQYALCVGTNERKNLERSIGACRKLGIHLVVVGESQNNMHVSSEVTYTGFVSNTELANLYRHAVVFLYPSLYEGFGLPILEAFALACPVVTSNLGSMQEIAGDAAVLVNNAY